MQLQVFPVTPYKVGDERYKKDSGKDPMPGGNIFHSKFGIKFQTKIP